MQSCSRLPPRNLIRSYAISCSQALQPRRCLRQFIGGLGPYVHTAASAKGGAQRPCVETHRDLAQSQPGNLDSWLKSLGRLLPSEARPSTISDVDKISQTYTILDRAWSAHRHDLLLHLSRQDRWADVVTIVQSLVKHYWRHVPSIRAGGVSPVASSPWQQSDPSQQLLSKPIVLQAQSSKESIARKSRNSRGHAVLALLWRSLGYIIINDAKRRELISPEILGILALFHETDIIPNQLYTGSENPGRPPTTLSMLSSHILNALSEADLRTRNKGRDLSVPSISSNRDVYEAFGSASTLPMFHFRPAVLRHEAWLELVLWSCIKGGWAMSGRTVLESLAVEKGYRKSGRAPPATHKSDMTKDASDILEAPLTLRVQHLDPQLIVAYSDHSFQSLAHISQSPETRLAMISDLWLYRYLLWKVLNHYSPEYWSTNVLRVLEVRATDLTTNLVAAYRLLDLVPVMSKLSAPELGRSAALVKFWIEVLAKHVEEGNLYDTLRAFLRVLTMSDRNKQLALRGFCAAVEEVPPSQPVRPSAEGPEQNAFFPQLSPDLLSKLMELVTKVGAYPFGRWLLKSEGPDAPIIPPILYGNWQLMPALVRFAASSRDRTLLDNVLTAAKSSVTGRFDIPSHWRVSILEAQVRLQDWDRAKTTLAEYMLKPSGTDDGMAIAVLACAALERGLDVGDGSNVALQLLQDAVRSESGLERHAIRTIVAVMAMADPDCAKTLGGSRIEERRFAAFSLPQQAFDHLLQGIVKAYGSLVGRRIIDDLVHDGGARDATSQTTFSGTSTLTVRAVNDVYEVRADGTLHPNALIFRTIVNRSREEYSPKSTEHRGTVIWAQARMKRLGLSPNALQSSTPAIRAMDDGGVTFSNDGDDP